jgi:hypothetical protein
MMNLRAVELQQGAAGNNAAMHMVRLACFPPNFNVSSSSSHFYFGAGTPAAVPATTYSLNPSRQPHSRNAMHHAPVSYGMHAQYNNNHGRRHTHNSAVCKHTAVCQQLLTKNAAAEKQLLAGLVHAAASHHCKQLERMMSAARRHYSSNGSQINGAVRNCRTCCGGITTCLSPQRMLLTATSTMDRCHHRSSAAVPVRSTMPLVLHTAATSTQYWHASGFSGYLVCGPHT